MDGPTLSHPILAVGLFGRKPYHYFSFLFLSSLCPRLGGGRYLNVAMVCGGVGWWGGGGVWGGWGGVVWGGSSPLVVVWWCAVVWGGAGVVWGKWSGAVWGGGVGWGGVVGVG